MSKTKQKETLGFQTEVKQLLHLMIHALYSNKEIFLRELISNASDAADKLRFAAISEAELLEADPELKVIISYDKDARTITLSDNGIGMSRQDVIDNLGTIAKSGTKEFLAALTGDQAKDANMIGQFGVGFYSAFIVADKVSVVTRRAGLSADQAIRWESAGEGDYTIEPTEKQSRGTEITLHLKADEDEFLDNWRLQHIIRKYSDHITLPIVMKKPVEETKDETDEKAEKAVEEYETVNRATALWALPKAEIKDSDYIELYKHISHDYADPLLWSHNRVEGKQEYISLLYIPEHAPFDMWNRDHKHGLKLYVRRVFIMEDADQFMPAYLRFVKGIVDSNDLPLNISREILQSNRQVDSIKTALTKRTLGMLEKLAQDDKEKYTKFWKEFGQALKEGPAEDNANKEQIAKLLRFASTHLDSDSQEVSFEDYLGRMKPGQDKIYYITAETFASAKNSPHLEIFLKKDIEVLLLTDRVDEWLVSHMTEFSGKQLQSVAKGSLDLGSLEDKPAEEESLKKAGDFESVLKQAKEVLGDQVKEVRLSERLTQSPACLVVDEDDMNSHMQRMLKAAGHAVPGSKPIFELNPDHPIIGKLKDETDNERFAEWTHILFDQAQLAEGSHLENPAQFVQRLNRLLLELAR